MSNPGDLGSSARIAAVCGVSSLVPLVQAGAEHVPESPAVPGNAREQAVEVVLPFDLQRTFSRSLPIAGLIVTPDQVAQLVLMNPRLRVTTDLPTSGKGTASSIGESNVADTHADLID